MAKLNIVLNRDAVSTEILKGPDVSAYVDSLARAALGRLGSGYSVNTLSGRRRMNAEVVAETQEAIADNLKNNTLLKAVQGK